MKWEAVKNTIQHCTFDRISMSVRKVEHQYYQTIRLDVLNAQKLQQINLVTAPIHDHVLQEQCLIEGLRGLLVK